VVVVVVVVVETATPANAKVLLAES